MSRYLLSTLARNDLDAIWDYIGIENDRPLAAHRLIEALVHRFELLGREPLIGQAREDLADLVKDVRSFSVRSYVIYYQPVAEGVRIARVLHGARDARAVFAAQPTQ